MSSVPREYHSNLTCRRLEFGKTEKRLMLMTQKEKTEVIDVLRRYRALGIAEKNLDERIAAEEQLLLTVELSEPPAGATEHEGNVSDRKRVQSRKRQLHLIDRLRSQRSVIRAERRAVERSLGALNSEEGQILRALFLESYTEQTPFDLMERLGYEKSNLYRIRAKALEHFADHYNGRAGRA